LLDQVKQAIRDSDFFVCVPESRPGFVESAVLRAFGLEKPLLFLVNESHMPRVANTAKKGYAVFDLDRFGSDGSRALVKFCSYQKISPRPDRH